MSTSLIEAALLTRLKASAALAALVGTRIFPHVARQGTVLPYLVYSATQSPEYDLGGNAVGLSQCEFTVEIYTEGEAAYKQGKQIVSEVRNMLDGLRASINVTVGVNVTSVSVRTCIIQPGGIADSYVAPIDGSEYGRAVHVLEFSVGFFESLPTASTL